MRRSAFGGNRGAPRDFFFGGSMNPFASLTEWFTLFAVFSVVCSTDSDVEGIIESSAMEEFTWADHARNAAAVMIFGVIQ